MSESILFLFNLFLFLTTRLSAQMVLKNYIVRVSTSKSCDHNGCVFMIANHRDGRLQFKSNHLQFTFGKQFGSQRCDFYIHRPGQTIAYISRCYDKRKRGKQVIEGVVYEESWKRLIIYNETTGQQEMDNWRLRDYRSIVDVGRFCATANDSRVLSSNDDEESTNNVRGLQKGRQTDEAELETAIVIDDLFLQRFSAGDKIKCEKMIYSVMNGMMALYVSLEMRIKIVDLRFLDKEATKEMVSGAKDADEMITNARIYFLTHIMTKIEGLADVRITFTGHLGEDDVGGIAYTGTICKRSNNAVIFLKKRQISDLQLQRMALATAHEVGHNLGLLHQDNCTDCYSGTEGHCIMNSMASYDSGSWSGCSEEEIMEMIHTSQADCIYRKNVTMMINTIPQDDMKYTVGPEKPPKSGKPYQPGKPYHREKPGKGSSAMVGQFFGFIFVIIVIIIICFLVIKIIKCLKSKGNKGSKVPWEGNLERRHNW